MADTEEFRRKGWVRGEDGQWRPVGSGPRPKGAGDTLDVSNEDTTLDASHRRLRQIAAGETARLRATSRERPLTGDEVEILVRLSNVWRVLVSNEPPPALKDLSDEEIAEKLAALNQRGK